MKFCTKVLVLFCGALATGQKFEPQHSSSYRVPSVYRPFQDLQQRPAEKPNSRELQLQESRQKPTQVQEHRQRPAQMHEPKQPQQQVAVQQKETFYEPIAWKFPGDPVEEPVVLPEFELKVPEPAQSVSIQCGEDNVHVEVKKDLFGTGKLILPSDITLGGCAPINQETLYTAEELIFESTLHGCGAQLMMFEDSFIYVFTLHYNPTPTSVGGGHIFRMKNVDIRLECHYQRKHEVSSDALKPAWRPYSDSKVGVESLRFSLKVMTDDWQYERAGAQYLMGDMMKFEASVEQFYHVPLRVFVDSCVATLIPNTDTVPRYAFLGNHGCLVDAKLTGSTSRFLPRARDDKLRFEVEAFRFQQDSSGVIYITCQLKATTESAGMSPTNKACSYTNGWTEAGGSDQSCSCCDSICGTRGQANLSPKTDAQWDYEMAVGPIAVKERPLVK